MPLVDSYGHVIKARNAVLVPATESKWVQLIGSNPWREESYVELGEDYLHPACFAGTSTVGNQLMNFLKVYVKASDIPHISPPQCWNTYCVNRTYQTKCISAVGLDSGAETEWNLHSRKVHGLHTGG
jgi:hypothetical protein